MYEAGSLGVSRLTIHTIGNPPTMAMAPQLTGLIGLPSIMLITVIPTPQMKHAQTDVVVMFFQYSPSMKGARNAPASAPHEIPISCAMNVGGLSAMSSDIVMKNTISTRIMITFRCSIRCETVSSIVPCLTSMGSDFLSR